MYQCIKMYEVCRLGGYGPGNAPSRKFGISGLPRLFLVRIKEQELDNLLQNAAIVLAIESLRLRHSQIWRRRGSAIRCELTERALSQHGF